MTQCEQLLDYLERNGSITGWECVLELGISNYKARISELRQDGYDIELVWETGVNRYGKKTRYGRYVYHARTS